eukprot:sb/3471042/
MVNKRKTRAAAAAAQVAVFTDPQSGPSVGSVKEPRSGGGGVNNKPKRCVQHKALLTTSLVSTMYLASWLPTLIVYFVDAWPFSDVRTPAWFEKLHPIAISVGSWGNPLLYTAVNRGFRKFVSKKLQYYSVTVSRKVDRMPEGMSDRNRDMVTEGDRGRDVVRLGVISENRSCSSVVAKGSQGGEERGIEESV